MRSILSTIPRIYISIQAQGLLELSGEAFRHLGRSRRLAVGDEFITFDGSGVDKRWRVVETAQGMLKGELVGEYEHINLPRVKLTLAFSPLKGGRSDDVIAMGTQMGVARFIPMMCARGVARLEGRRAEERVRRWNEICRRNSGFSLRSDVPVVSDVMGFRDVLDLSDFDVRYILYEGERGYDARVRVDDGRSALALIGPEGGFEGDEVEAAVRGGFEAASLGPFILKADAAALKAIGVIIG